MSNQYGFDRRKFLAGTGYAAVAFGLGSGEAAAQAQAPAATPAAPAAATPPARPPLPGNLNTNRMLDSWIRINADKTVGLLIGKVELGQGIVTAAAQVCADELDVDMARLRITSGDTFLVPNEGTTAGSQSMTGCAVAVRAASAEIRQIMLELAAKKLNEPVEALLVEDGTIKGKSGSTTYWDLVTGKELAREATGTAKPKAASAYKYMGKPIVRLDIPAKMTGDAIFVHEYRPQGVVYGRVVRPPTYKAKLTSIDLKVAEAMPGVLKVVRNGSFLGVVATREDQAINAATALGKAAQWAVEKALPGSENIFDWLVKQKPTDIAVKNDVRKDTTAVARVVEATYQRPYQMHASIGTSAAVATLGADGVTTIQTHSQSVFETAAAIAKMLKVDAAKVRCQHMQGSGCYGHNMADDAAADAALLAQAVPGKPVKLQYTREDEHRWEPYGSAMVVKTKAGLDKDGNVLDWDLELWSTPHGTRPGGNAGNLLSARYLETPFEMPTPQNGGPPNYSADRNAIALYEFPGHKVTTHFITEMPLRVSSTRGLGAYGNVFAIESFMDELAAAAGVDPVAFRLRFLKDERARDVVSKAAEKFGWATYKKEANRGRGIGFARYKNNSAYTAVALEVEVNRRTGRVRVLRAVAANDSGHMVNPDGVANQIEGGLIQSLSWSLKEEVMFDDTRVTSEDWASYPILTFSEVPPIDLVLIDRPGQPYLGTGESAQGPAGAALANAIFDATGVRFRRLPYTPDRVKAGLPA